MSKNFLLSWVFLFLHLPLMAQQKEISGSISDPSGMKLPGVNVIIQGTTNGTVSDFDGAFTLGGVSPEDKLLFSYIGYASQEIIIGDTDFFEVVLEEELEQLEEVIVVGYGAVKKSDMTGAVNSLKAEDLPARPAVNVEELLQGQAAGLQITNSSGQPGAGVEVRLRGISSAVGANSPLIVVDGFPLGDAGGLNQINPADIATFDVLKDASATAIYGSRGANGVIMITTKSGKTGKMSVSFNARTSVSQIGMDPNIVSDPEDFAIFSNEARRNAGLAQFYVGQSFNGTYYPAVAEIRDGSWGHSTNWADVVYRKALTHDYSVSANGGTEKSKYYFSLGYLGQEGINIGDKFSKYNFRFKYDAEVYRNLTAGANVIINVTDRQNNGMGGAGRSPVFPVHDEEGNYFFIGGQDFWHPLVYANEVTNNTQGRDVISNLYLEYKITDDLKIKSQMNAKFGASLTDIYEPIGLTSKGFEFEGYGAISNYWDTDLLNETYITYDKSINKHSFSAMVGQSYQVYHQRTSFLEAQGFVNDNMANEDLSSAKNTLSSNTGMTTQMLSYYGRLNYSYDSRYLLTATFRADGSSRLAKKWNGFSSFAAGWNISNEAFLQDVDFLSDLKLRASWGQAGNQSVAPYSAQQRYGSSRYYNGNDWSVGFGPGVYQYDNEFVYKIWSGLGNGDLHWETTATTNIGLDASILDSRVMLTAEYYHKVTDGLLRSEKIPPSSGYDEVMVNSGSMLNKGYEISMDVALFTADRGDFEWNVKGTFSRNRNEILDIGDEDFVWWGGNVEQFRSPLTVLVPGQPFAAFYGYRTNGIIQTVEEGMESGLSGNLANPGEIKYVDLDGNGTVGPEDREVIGDPNPDFIYSINSRMSYKNWDFSFLLNGVQGNDVFNTTKFDGAAQYYRWTPDNRTDDYPSLYDGRGYMASDWWIEDGSFLRVQNITLGYRLNTQNINWLQSCRFYMSADNVAVFSKFQYGYDPEVGADGMHWGGYPQPRTFSLGLNLTLN
ncbi:TonB-dependent receptor [Persicobacter diffluens]|uniref:SusC/RagA family TonB-linked outer membrane protein n=1 Tax=Persicobacter diffluens TaxID=981 RepID=A0AAN5AN33_9BACT|nr:SusC/RagA family TonB-linked outer membrane protein [Persicobacter diffluens]